MYQTAEDFEKAIQDYFDSLKYVDSEGIERSKPPTVSGLAYYLGYADRQSLYDQEDRGEDFLRVKKRAILFIQSYHEEMLGNPTNRNTGPIFWLKNHGWSDNRSIELGNKNDSALNINLIGDSEPGELDELHLNGK